MDFLYLTPWPLLTFVSLFMSISMTFMIVPFFLKISNTLYGLWYRDMTEDDDMDQDLLNMVVTATAIPARVAHALLTTFFGFTIWWSGVLSPDTPSHADNIAAQFVIAVSLGFNLYEFSILFIVSDWTDRLNAFVTNYTVHAKILKSLFYICALVSI